MFKSKQSPLVLELDKAKKVPALTSTTRDSVIALRNHPGFQYLHARLQVDKAILEAKLRRERHKDLVDVAYLQAGITWINYLEAFLVREEAVASKATPREANPLELSAFEASMSSIEEIAKV